MNKSSLKVTEMLSIKDEVGNPSAVKKECYLQIAIDKVIVMYVLKVQ